MMSRRGRGRDEGVSAVVGAILVLGIMVAFVANVRLTWVPQWVEGGEAAHAEDVREDVAGWADAAEIHVARDLENRTFVHTLRVGYEGIPMLGAGASPGRMQVEEGPTITIFAGSTVVATARGAFSVSTGATNFPAQTFRYVFGAIETTQGDDAWVDLRAMLAPERIGGGQIQLSVQVVGFDVAKQEVGTGGSVQVLTTLGSVASSSQTNSTARILVEDVEAGAWRNAINRVFATARMQSETIADCGVSTKDYCFDSDINDLDTVDLTIRGLAPDWSVVSGTLRVELRT